MTSKVVSALAICFFVASSCRKNPSEQPVPPVESAGFVVTLDKACMPGSQIDSAFATWEVNGQKQIIKLQKDNDTLKAPISNFHEGNGRMTLHLYSAIKFQNQYLSQWFHEKQVTIQHSHRIKLNGPTGFHDGQWKPRVLLKSGSALNLQALVALRPDDPYFLVKNLGMNVLKITVARNFWNTIAGVRQVGGGEWVCSTGCTDADRNVENQEYFKFLPTQIGTKAWNHIEIVVLYETDRWGGGPVLAMDHEF